MPTNSQSNKSNSQLPDYQITQLPDSVSGRAAAVREMFTEIAPRYDRLNHLLSFGVDRIWWRRAAVTFTDLLRRDESCVLDLCCGTGDMSFALAHVAHAGQASPRIFGVDFSHEMLVRAAGKYRDAGWENSIRCRWIEADALRLPFADASFQLVTSAFGFRNLADYDAGLRQIFRVLSPGGEVGILDFAEPGGLFGKVYGIYFRHVLPAVGTFLSGVRGPYAYLPASVHGFPGPDEMLGRMRMAGFRPVSWTPYTGGIAGLYRGTRPSTD